MTGGLAKKNVLGADSNLLSK